MAECCRGLSPPAVDKEPDHEAGWSASRSVAPLGSATVTADALDTVRLVLGIARLGEMDLRGWWRAHGLDRTGEYVLSGMFSRTWRSAALELDVAAATRMHQELLGRVSAVHLFSDLVPFGRWARGWLAEQKTASEVPDLMTDLAGWSETDAVTALRGWCDEAEAIAGESLGSGLLLGRLRSDDLEDPAVLLRVARQLSIAYLDQTDTLRPPYFDLAR